MNDILGLVHSHITLAQNAMSFGLVNKDSLKWYMKNITKLRKFMSKFVQKGAYVNHILYMNEHKGAKLCREGEFRCAIEHYKLLDYCQYCWLADDMCYCDEIDYHNPHLYVDYDINFINVQYYFARIQ